MKGGRCPLHYHFAIPSSRSIPTGSSLCSTVSAIRFAYCSVTSSISDITPLARATRNGKDGFAAARLLLITHAHGSIPARRKSCCRFAASSTGVVSVSVAISLCRRHRVNFERVRLHVAARTSFIPALKFCSD